MKNNCTIIKCISLKMSVNSAVHIHVATCRGVEVNCKLQYRSEISKPKHTRNTRMLIRIYAYAHARIRVLPYAYAYTKYTRMLISIYELAYCCFLCNTVVKCCFNGLVILRLYGLTKSLRAKYGRTSHSFTKSLI